MNYHITLDSFKGQGEDPSKWYSHFERYAMFNKLKVERGLSYALSLKGHSKDMVRLLIYILPSSQ